MCAWIPTSTLTTVATWEMDPWMGTISLLDLKKRREWEERGEKGRKEKEENGEERRKKERGGEERSGERREGE